jgi:molybdopterin/thiamine biosynthesis adenylyltransferase
MVDRPQQVLEDGRTPTPGVSRPCGLQPAKRPNQVLIVGCGHIGRHLPSLVAETGQVGLIRMVDRGRVTAAHVVSEGYPAESVGRFKADVLCQRWAAQFPQVTFEAICADLEDVPLGDFEVDVVLAALDSRRARQALVSERAYPLGVPVIDGGVGDGLLGSVRVFRPGSACLECGFGPQDYRSLATEYACHPDGVYLAPPTTAPAFVAAVVAGIMTAEMVGVLSGNQAGESSEIFFDLATRRFLTSRRKRAGRCRFDHQIVTNYVCPDVPFASATVGDVLRIVRQRFGSSACHLEFRRGVLRSDQAFPTDRLVTPGWLDRQEARRLAELGLTPRDRIRIHLRGQSPSAFVILGQPNLYSRTEP